MAWVVFCFVSLLFCVQKKSERNSRVEVYSSRGVIPQSKTTFLPVGGGIITIVKNGQN